MFDGSKSVLERSSVGHSSGQFFCAWNEGIFRNTVASSCSLGGFQADGMRLRNTVADLSEALPRLQ